MVSLTTRIDNLENNGFINGNFDIWQRCTSAINLGGGGSVVYAADRWGAQHVGSATVTYGQDTVVPTVAQSGFQSTFSAKLTCTAGHAGDSFCVIFQTIEGYDWARFHGRPFRLQFQVRTSVAGTYSMRLRNGNSDIAYITSYTIGAGQVNTYVTVALDIPANVAGTFTFLNGAAMNILWNLCGGSGSTANVNQWTLNNASNSAVPGQVDWSANTGATFNLSQVMLIPQDFTQAGSSNVVVPFRRCGSSIGHEFTLCQRYCETSADLGTPFFTSGGSALNAQAGYQYWNGNSNSGTLIPVYMQIPKRVPIVGGTNFHAYSTSGAADNVRDNSALVDRAVSYTGNGAIANSKGIALYVPTATTGAYQLFFWIADCDF